MKSKYCSRIEISHSARSSVNRDSSMTVVIVTGSVSGVIEDNMTRCPAGRSLMLEYISVLRVICPPLSSAWHFVQSMEVSMKRSPFSSSLTGAVTVLVEVSRYPLASGSKLKPSGNFTVMVIMSLSSHSMPLAEMLTGALSKARSLTSEMLSGIPSNVYVTGDVCDAFSICIRLVTTSMSLY